MKERRWARRSLRAAVAIGIAASVCSAGWAAAATELVQKGNLRVSFRGTLRPKKLPRQGTAAITVRVGGRIFTTDGADPPGLTQISIAINRRARLDPAARPSCTYDQIQPSTTAYARKVCAGARVGEGTFSASVAIPEQAPYPSQGTVTAFNGTDAGRPVIFLHIYGTEPLPTSFTLPLRMSRGSGQFGTVLTGQLPSVDAHVGFVTGIALELDGGSRSGRPYLAAGCPAAKGFPGAIFPLTRAEFRFADGRKLRSTLVESCTARG